jgi:hypothetical protein
MRALVKEANGETVACPGQGGWLQRAGSRTPKVFARRRFSGLIALVEAIQDRAHEWNGAQNRNLQTVW